MATTERDYYELLGVERTATEAEIKKAFRAVARELHPDVSDDPNAEERFKEVAEAYEVLSNAERRELYDRFGHAGLRSRGYAPSSFDFSTLGDLFSVFFGDDLFGVGGRQRRAARGADVAAGIEVELVEAARGVQREVPFRVAVACSACEGSGAEPGTEPTTCPTCGGAGRHTVADPRLGKGRCGRRRSRPLRAGPSCDLAPERRQTTSAGKNCCCRGSNSASRSATRRRSEDWAARETHPG